MANQAQTQTGNRLAPQPAEQIDRDTEFTFTFDGKEYTAFAGDTIASALAAAGVKITGRSFKYHRPRGLLCCAGHCPNCLVQVGDEPNVRACRRPVASGMEVTPLNVWPSLKRDLMSLTEWGSRFTPVGFYYKTFIRPQRLWPFYEHLLRQAAGLGEVDPGTPPGEYDKQYLHAEVTVVGGGPAGLSAALAAAEQGARVLLFDENEAPGGHLRFAGEQGVATLSPLLAALAQQENVTVYTNTTVLGQYEDNWLSAVQGNRLFKIRAGGVIVATGAYEQPLIFDNNDLPGVMMGSGVARLLHLYGVVAGKRAVIVTTNDDGWRLAHDLHAAGVTIAGIADQRPNSGNPFVASLSAAQIPIFWNHTIVAAQGSGTVKTAVIAPLDEQQQVNTAARRSLACDLVALSVGWAPASGLLYQGGGRLAYDEQHAQFLPDHFPDGVFAAGRVAGTHVVENQLVEGTLAGLHAAAYLGLEPGIPTEGIAELHAAKTAESPTTSSLVKVPGKKKRFICFCEDVTDKDLEVAIAEGYNSIELLKRYSTISMGPCQGKMCSLNTIHLCARANGWSVAETGTTTARPPMTPVKLGVLAGQNMEPVKYTPLHQWHVAHGAKMMVAGLWLRPEHYGDPTAEVEAVRERVGLIDVSTLGKLRLTGPGVPDLLDRLYINKWQKLGVGRVRYGVMCNDEGIVLDDGVTAHLEPQEWYTTTTSSGANAIYEWIQWWLQSGWGDGVHVTAVTEDNAAFNLAGPQSRAVLQKLTTADLSGEAFPYMHARLMEVAGVPCRVLRIGFTGELSYEIHCPAGYGRYFWQSIMAAGEAMDIMPFGVEAQRVLRLEKAHIIIGQDTDALTDPFAADMGWAVKLDKEDFLGQRSLVRVAEEGSPQRLTGFKMARPGIVPDEGLQIVERDDNGCWHIIGWVTSSRYSPTLQETIGLCWLPPEIAAQAGAAFTIRTGDGALEEAHVHHGAFYDAEGARLRM